MIKKQNTAQFKVIITAILCSMLIMTGTVASRGEIYAQSFDIKDFKIKKFGVSHHQPFVIVDGKAGHTKAAIGDRAIEGYLFYTNKGNFGAFSNEGPYNSSKFTTKTSNGGINGDTCIGNQTATGKVVTSGHKLTIKEINVKKINKVLTADINKNPDQNGNVNCILKIWSSKGH